MRIVHSILPKGLCLLPADAGSGAPVVSGDDSYAAKLERFQESAQGLQQGVARFLDDFRAVLQDRDDMSAAYQGMRAQLETMNTIVADARAGAAGAAGEARTALQGIVESAKEFMGEQSPFVVAVSQALAQITIVEQFLKVLETDELAAAVFSQDELTDAGAEPLTLPASPHATEGASAPPSRASSRSPSPRTLASIERLITWGKPKKGRRRSLDKGASKRFNLALSTMCGLTISFSGQKDQGVTNGHVRSTLGAARSAFGGKHPELIAVIDAYARVLGADDAVYVLSTAERRKHHPKDIDVRIMNILLGIFKHRAFEKSGWTQQMEVAAAMGAATVSFDDLITWRDESTEYAAGVRFARVMNKVLDLNVKGTGKMNVGLIDQAVRFVLKRVETVFGERHPELVTAIDAYRSFLGGDNDPFDVLSPTRCQQYGFDDPRVRRMTGLLDIFRHPVFGSTENIQALKV